MTGNYAEMAQLRDIIVSLEDTITKTNAKNHVQKSIFAEYIRIFHKLAEKLVALSNRINEQILSAQDENEQSIANVYQHLSNSLLRMADCSKNVSQKAKNEVLDPMKLFVDNYENLNNDLLVRLRAKEAELAEKYNDLARNRDTYLAASDKLEKNRKIQGKSMVKIENGDLEELDKFNNNIKKITESIKFSEQNYINTVNSINNSYDQLRVSLKDIVRSLSYNEQSRISFSRKSLASSIRIIEDFKNFYDNSLEKKIEDSLKKGENQKADSVLKKNLNARIGLLAFSNFKQQFVSYQDLIRQKRKKNIQQQNSYLNEVFVKVPEVDKQLINTMIKPWFHTGIQRKVSNATLESPSKPRGPRAQQLEQLKQKIHLQLPHSYYFIESIYQQIVEMSSFYCKLGDEDFLMLQNMFVSIASSLELQENTPSALLAIEFVYKMIQVSMRIMWRKNSKSNKGQPIDLLSQHFGRKCKCLSNQINLKKLFIFIQKKKVLKKANPNPGEQPKGMVNSFVKGVAGIMSRKKQQTLTEEQNFNCLTEITQIMANLLIPSEIAIPFIKSLLDKNENNRSFEYLKSILLEKKDIQERQKIFYQTEIKGKKQQKLKRILQSKKLAEQCLRLTAKRGFFTKEELGLRLVCKDLASIHQEILCRLDISTQEWIHLIPLNNKLDYVQMKQEVAEKSVPSAVEQIITLDVNRSLHNHGETLSPTVLHSLLRIYAYFHQDISYCQGMNYIAGYLYIKTGDEESAYRIFEYLMEVRFRELFANQFEVLKVKMYQFERLLGIFHPEISDHFKKQSISPECYIVSWIITLFASSYQYTMDSYLIDVLWERFIIWGWREFFRFVLSLFNLYKQELIELTYDKALHFLGEMGRSEMFLTGKKDYKAKYPENKVEEGMEQYPITEELLENLKKQYRLN